MPEQLLKPTPPASDGGALAEATVPTGYGRSGVVVSIIGLAATATGLFALPLNSYPRNYGGSYGFVEFGSAAAQIGGRSPIPGHPLFSGLALFWWSSGAFVIGGLLVAALCVLVAAPRLHALGWLVAVLGALGGVLHGLAMAQSADYRGGVVTLRGYSVSNVYDHAGSGVYVSLIGFAVLLVGGVVIALGGRRRIEHGNRPPATRTPA